ncbi:MAG: hypothetical protein JW929_00655 [Anaerolineales bacterium]|nr:hypothetical protein [Anaerolineales bacterium]
MNAELRLLRTSLGIGGSVVAAAALLLLFAPSDPAPAFVSSILPLLLSLAAAVMAGGVFFRHRKDAAGAKIWGAMTLGLACWSLAEGVWAGLYAGTGGEVPVPSAADLFWLIGYLPLGFSIAYQYSLLRATIPRSGRLWLGGILTGLAVVLAAAIMLPVFADPSSGPALQAAVSVAYSLGDIVVLSFALALVFVFFGGDLALSWGVIAAGILLHAVSDLLFGYAEWHGLYYPGGRLNALSAAFDLLYIAAYAVWNIGLFLRLRLPDPGTGVEIRSFLPEQGKDFLLMADKDGRVVFLDPALARMLGMRGPGEGVGVSFGKLVGLAGGYERAALHKASKTGLSDDYTVLLGLFRRKYRLRVVVSSDPSHLPGYDILILPEESSAAPETGREDLLLGRLAERTREREVRRRFSGGEDPLRSYCGIMIELLYVLVARAAGAGVGAAFEGVLDRKARETGIAFELRRGRVSWGEPAANPGAYRPLLDQAVSYSREILSAEAVDRKLREMEKFIDPGILREADAARLRGDWRRKRESGNASAA